MAYSIRQSTLFRRRSGTPLPELLMELGIIILSTMGLGVLGRVRENGRKNTYQSNLRQIGLAPQQYAQDHDGRYTKISFSSRKS